MVGYAFPVPGTERTRERYDREFATEHAGGEHRCFGEPDNWHRSEFAQAPKARISECRDDDRVGVTRMLGDHFKSHHSTDHRFGTGSDIGHSTLRGDRHNLGRGRCDAPSHGGHSLGHADASVRVDEKQPHGRLLSMSMTSTRSTHRANESKRRSRPRAATIWRPTGSPSRPDPQGIEIAGVLA